MSKNDEIKTDLRRMQETSLLPSSLRREQSKHTEIFFLFASHVSCLEATGNKRKSSLEKNGQKLNNGTSEVKINVIWEGNAKEKSSGY